MGKILGEYLTNVFGARIDTICCPPSNKSKPNIGFSVLPNIWLTGGTGHQNKSKDSRRMEIIRERINQIENEEIIKYIF